VFIKGRHEGEKKLVWVKCNVSKEKLKGHFQGLERAGRNHGTNRRSLELNSSQKEKEAATNWGS